MEAEIQYVNGKKKSTFVKRGVLYTRKGYDVPVNEVEKFTRKVHQQGKTETEVIETFIRCFNVSTGWGEETKSAGSLPEKRSSEHIKEAVRRAIGELFPWEVN